MPIPAGNYVLGPGHGRLVVLTQRTGAAAKAGHNLTIHVTSWEAGVAVGETVAETVVNLSVDGGSLRVHEGKGGMQALGEDDKADIEKTIDDEVLKRENITFHSTRAEPLHDGGGVTVSGDLTLNHQTRPISFDVIISDAGHVTATAEIRQSDFGMKPYSTLFGALKVVDEVTVQIDANLPVSSSEQPATQSL
jgi:polyisoprenoid-binding protein YceI